MELWLESIDQIAVILEILWAIFDEGVGPYLEGRVAFEIHIVEFQSLEVGIARLILLNPVVVDEFKREVLLLVAQGHHGLGPRILEIAIAGGVTLKLELFVALHFES